MACIRPIHLLCVASIYLLSDASIDSPACVPSRRRRRYIFVTRETSYSTRDPTRICTDFFGQLFLMSCDRGLASQTARRCHLSNASVHDRHGIDVSSRRAIRPRLRLIRGNKTAACARRRTQRAHRSIDADYFCAPLPPRAVHRRTNEPGFSRERGAAMLTARNIARRPGTATRGMFQALGGNRRCIRSFRRRRRARSVAGKTRGTPKTAHMPSRRVSYSTRFRARSRFISPCWRSA